MNCTECGAALLLDRVIFRCSCGAYVHAYCSDAHIIHAHRPDFEEGYVDLNGDFRLKPESPCRLRASDRSDVGRRYP